MNAWSITTGITLVLAGHGCTSSKQLRRFDPIQDMVRKRSSLLVQPYSAGDGDNHLEQPIQTLLSDGLSANEAVQIALVKNRAIHAIYEELTIAQADLMAAGLMSNPVFDAEVRFESGGSGTALALAVVQDFLDVFLIPLRKKMAGAALEEAQMRVTAAVLNLAGEVKGRYFVYQAAEQVLEMRLTVLAATDASYELARRLHEAGNITDLELANEQALHEQSKLDASTAEIDADLAREQLNSVMGLWGNDTAWTLNSRLPDPIAFDVGSEEFERNAISNSLDLEATRLEVIQAATRLGIAKPSAIFAEANLGIAAERDPVDSVEWTVGPAFSVPIPLFNWGQAASMKAQATFRQGWERYTSLAVQIRAEARAVHRRLRSLGAQALHYREVVLPLRHRIVEETQKQYNAMQVGAFQLLEAKKQEIHAGAAYLATLRDYWLARTDAERILSGVRASSERLAEQTAQVRTFDFGRREELGGTDD